MATKPAKEEKESKLNRTISNGTRRLHTHVNRGGGRMRKRVIVPIYSTAMLDENIKAQLCDRFISQMVKVALSNLDDKNTDIPSD